MSENFKPTNAETPPPISHTRILWIMAIVSLAAATGCLIFADWSVSAGLMLGGILSFVNYYWLKFALHSVFEKVVDGEKPNFLVGKYILRYFAIGAVIIIVYLTKIISAAAVIAGLLTFAAAILIESLILVFIHFSKQEET